jgi:RNA polymerase sigma factor (TIGR02999 family)
MADLSDHVLYESIYAQLRRLAHRERQRVGASPTLNTTALVHETYLSLNQAGHDAPRDFHAYASRAMRNLLIDEARKRARPKHGGGLLRADSESAANEVLVEESQRTLDLDEALTALAKVDPRAAEVVELHYFGGLEFGPIAERLNVSERTVQRDWRAARAWLKRELEER